MKKLLFFLLVIVIPKAMLWAQLSGQAQVLFDSVYAQDSTMVNTALNEGVQLFSTPDSNSFYLQWFPTGVIPSETPLVVSLHGSGCNAFMEFNSWYSQAQLHGCGIIAVQWYRYSPNPPHDYFPDDTLYSYINLALTNIAYPAEKALLHGFSRGSARSYAIIFNDIQSGNNYFCTTISNAGYVDLSYPLYNSIDTGAYGANFFAGKHWNLFCGPPEPPIVGGACEGMDFTQVWLQNQGAIVDIYIQDSLLGHNGFQQPSSFEYKDTVLNKYLECYSGTSSIYENKSEVGLMISPNPFFFQTTISFDKVLVNATITVYNLLGQQVKQLKKIGGKTVTLDRDNLSSEIYFIQILQNNKIIAKDRIVILD